MVAWGFGESRPKGIRNTTLIFSVHEETILGKRLVLERVEHTSVLIEVQGLVEPRIVHDGRPLVLTHLDPDVVEFLHAQKFSQV